MRTVLFPLAFTMAIAAAGTAHAASSTGAIQAINPEQLTVTLADGTVYSFPQTREFHDKLAHFKIGDMVSINWVVEGTALSADAISPLN